MLIIYVLENKVSLPKLTQAILRRKLSVWEEFLISGNPVDPQNGMHS